ncbi:peptidoglycan-binding domain-containing protein [Streptomyces sp. NPDC089919]|uniref:peptidoglycan-binding domain-containing protein n=1 Tax=Streptomyces sp. NPDC089919 TaxID=3155188 RepID=UPI00341F7080
MKKWLLGSLVALVALGGGGYVVSAQPHREDPDGAGDRRSDGLPPDTAPVARGDLSNGVQVDGVLGYAKERALNAAAAGTLTWLAGGGSVVSRDQPLYEVDGRPVRLMYGARPMYRSLKAGDKGEDVKQLKANLVALGYGTGLDPEDGTYTEGTVRAVERWQKAHKMKRTGQVAVGDVAFAAGPQRVRSAEAAVGDQAAPGKPVLSLTGTERVVRLELDVTAAGAVTVGDKVSVGLPGGGSATGRVSSVGASAKGPDDKGGGGGGGGDQKPKVEVLVSFDRAGDVKGPDGASVSVGLTGETARDVLSVPVNALLALAGGGFGVQVVADGTVREVRVELGMFGQGRVEVKGGALKEGMRVGVPKT